MVNHCESFRGKRIPILERTLLAQHIDPNRRTEIHRMVLDAGLEWGETYQPGQFVMVRADELGERIPLTVTDYDPVSGHLTLIFQALGASTHRLAKFQAGDRLEDLTHPLGTPLSIHPPRDDANVAIVVAGGIGLAPAYAKVDALHKAGYDVVTLMGARTKGLLILLDELRDISKRVIITTDDGSYDGPDAAYYGTNPSDPPSRKLFGVHVLEQMIDYRGKTTPVSMPALYNAYPSACIEEIFVVGPPMMMRSIADATRTMGIKTLASLNSTMVDGSGMCGGCKVTLRRNGAVPEAAYTCTEGPTFDAHEIDWDVVLERAAQYRRQESLTMSLFERPEATSVSDFAEAGDTFLPRLAERLQLTPSATLDQVMDRMAGQFEHVAGYLSLKEAVESADHCRCKMDVERIRPCQGGCPLEVHVQGFVGHLKLNELLTTLGLDANAANGPEAAEQRLVQVLIDAEEYPDHYGADTLAAIDRGIYAAYKVLTASNPIPEITGLVCPQENQCMSRESGCVRGRKGEPTEIGRLEAFVARWVRVHHDRMAHHDWFQPFTKVQPTGKRVMVIGSGPAGLVAAAELAKQGHQVVVYETLHEPGGVLMYGIPEFRLPKEIVRYEIARIADLGVIFELNHPIRDLDDHMNRHHFDAAFIGTGAGTPRFLEVPGENLTGVYSANEFLVRVNLMRAFQFPKYATPVPAVLGGRVVVFGGGNVAMDSARCALRLGADRVTVMYRRSENEIPARKEEHLAAIREGIEFKYLTTPFELAGEGNALRGVHYYDNVLGEPDSSGRRRPFPIKDKAQFIEASIAIVAIGQDPNEMMDKSGYKLDRGGRIIVNQETYETSVPDVYAGGDIIANTGGTVIFAAGCGLKAAQALNMHLA